MSRMIDSDKLLDWMEEIREDKTKTMQVTEMMFEGYYTIVPHFSEKILKNKVEELVTTEKPTTTDLWCYDLERAEGENNLILLLQNRYDKNETDLVYKCKLIDNFDNNEIDCTSEWYSNQLDDFKIGVDKDGMCCEINGEGYICNYNNYGEFIVKAWMKIPEPKNKSERQEQCTK